MFGSFHEISIVLLVEFVFCTAHGALGLQPIKKYLALNNLSTFITSGQTKMRVEGESVDKSLYESCFNFHYTSINRLIKGHQFTFTRDIPE